MTFEEKYEEIQEVISMVVYKNNYKLKMSCEDLEQELFLYSYEQFDKMKDKENFQGYLYTALKHYVSKLMYIEHEQGLFLEGSNIKIGSDGEFDILDLVDTSGDVQFEIKDEFVEAYLERRRAAIRKYNKTEKGKAARKRYYEKTREKWLEYSREHNKKYRAENREKLNEYHKKYREENKEKIKEQQRIFQKKYREEHKEELKEKRKQEKELLIIVKEFMSENNISSIDELKEILDKVSKGL